MAISLSLYSYSIMKLKSLVLASTLASIAVAREVTGIFNSLSPITNIENPANTPLSYGWVATIGWSISGGEMAAGDTFKLNFPCVFLATAQPVALRTSAGVFANCRFSGGLVLSIDSTLTCTATSIVELTSALGTITVPLTFNIGLTYMPIDLQCANTIHGGDNIYTINDGENDLTNTAVFVPGRVNNFDPDFMSSYFEPTGRGDEQRSNAVGGNCPNGYTSGILGFSTTDLNFDCESMKGSLSQGLNDWGMPVTDDANIELTCSENSVLMTYSNVPAGYRPYVSGFVGQSDVKLIVDYQNEFTCAGSTQLRNYTRTIRWATFGPGTPGSDGIDILTLTQTWTLPGTSTRTFTYNTDSDGFGTQTIIINVPIPTVTTTETWTGVGTETTTITATPGDTASVIVELPIPTVTTTVTWTGTFTSTTTFSATPGETATVSVDVPTPINPTITVTETWTGEGTTISTTTDTEGGTDTVIVEIPIPTVTTTVTWTGTFTSTTTFSATPGETATVSVDVPTPTKPVVTITETWTGVGTTTSTTITDGETDTVIVDVPIPTVTITSTWTGTGTQTTTIPGVPGETGTVIVEVPFSRISVSSATSPDVTSSSQAPWNSSLIATPAPHSSSDITNLSIVTVYPSQTSNTGHPPIVSSPFEPPHPDTRTTTITLTSQKPPNPSHGPGEPQVQPPKSLTATVTERPTDASSRHPHPTTGVEHSSSVNIATPTVSTFELAASLTGVSKFAACLVLALTFVF